MAHLRFLVIVLIVLSSTESETIFKRLVSPQRSCKLHFIAQASSVHSIPDNNWRDLESAEVVLEVKNPQTKFARRHKNPKLTELRNHEEKDIKKVDLHLESVSRLGNIVSPYSFKKKNHVNVIKAKKKKKLSAKKFIRKFLQFFCHLTSTGSSSIWKAEFFI